MNILRYVFLLLALTPAALAADWPQYRADAARSGCTDGKLSKNLALQWRYTPPHAPAPAWLGTDTRMFFDHAHHAVIANGTLFYGSSADGKVYALDAESAEERWSFFTGAPVRFAPACWNGRVFAVSDDGHLYCLSATDGALLWKKRGGPGADMLLGNDRMISRWPARGGVAIADGVLYFGAGIWPSEGIYLYALDAATGEQIWLNDSSGGLVLDQPHSTAVAKSGTSAQGYLAVLEDSFFVPTGRGVPAVFNRKDGAFHYLNLQAFRVVGGSSVVPTGSHFINGGYLFDTATGLDATSLSAQAVAVSPEQIVWAAKGALKAIDRSEPFTVKHATDRKGKPVKRVQLASVEWEIAITGSPVVSLVLSRDRVLYGAEDGTVAMVDIKTEKELWQTKVAGQPYGLAIADGCLYVSTSDGAIHCFGKGGGAARDVVARTRKAPAAADAGLAAKILDATGVREGYCALLGCGDGGLARTLAEQSALQVYAVDSDLENVRRARAMLEDAGLYGVRVTVHHAETAAVDYPNYFADLTVVAGAWPQAECERLTRPYGGVVYAVAAGEKTVKGTPEGAGEWTHQYADAANTCASTDTVVRGPIEALWFRDTDFEMPSRHGRGPAPLFSEGRLHVEGLHGIRTANAYNGRTLWEYPLPSVLVPYDQEHLVGTAGTQSNLCLSEGVLYVRRHEKCLRLDAATGKLLGEFSTPPAEGGKPGVWGYIARENGLLYGSTSITDHVVHWAYRESVMDEIFTESSNFFALDKETGELKWRYDARESIRHNAIAVAAGKVFLIDRPLEAGDLLQTKEAIAKRRGLTPKPNPNPPVLLALDAATGEELWRATEDVYGSLLAVSAEHDILLMTEQHTRFKLPSETGGRMTAFRASGGARLWDAPSDPQGKASRPMIIGTAIYNEPGAWDLLTGKRLDFRLERSYGCGIMSGCENLLLYRSATLGYADPKSNEGTVNYGGLRPGCWINAIPAGGIVLMPDATARCRCSYLIRAWAAFQTAG